MKNYIELNSTFLQSDENLNCCWTEAEKLEQELNQKGTVYRSVGYYIEKISVQQVFHKLIF